MRKIICILLTVLLISGCTPSNINNNITNNEITVTETKTNYEIYDKIIKTYAEIIALPMSDTYEADMDVLKNNLKSTIFAENPNYYLDSHLSECRMGKLSDIGFLYYDINDDGIDELIFNAVDSTNKSLYTISIYTQYSNNAYGLCFGWSRNRYYCGSDGYIYSEGSSGASSSSFEKLSINFDLYELYCINHLRLEYIDETSSPWYYSDNGQLSILDITTAITQEEAYSIKSNFKDKYLTFQTETLYDYLQHL